MIDAFTPAAGGAAAEPCSWWWGHKAKRTVDLIVALIALILLLPVMAVITVAIKLDSSGPVTYGQRRIGFGDLSIRVLKFRTMRTDLDLTHLSSQAIRSDPRLTRVGQFLRRTSLDELPQFFNVLSGEMSLVGPRPLLYADMQFYLNENSSVNPLINEWWAARKSLPPGVITPDKILGREDIAPSDLMEIEIFYVKHHSLLLDIKALLLSLPLVLRSRGAW